MTKEELIAFLKAEFAAEEFFTGVLGNRNSVFKPYPRRRPGVRKKIA